MYDSLSFCLTASTAVKETETLEDWIGPWRALTREKLTPVELAVRGGFQADRVAWAFLSGYQAALRSLLASSAGLAAGPDELLAFCATESGGNRPRDIATTFSGEGAALRVNGEKSWTALGSAATSLLVVGRQPSDGERPQLRVACVPSTAEGVVFIEKPPMPYVPYAPEIVHTASRFDDVMPVRSTGGLAGGLLPGDGYGDYVKPFRSIEDTFVALAVQSWLLREARARSWPETYCEQLLTQLMVLCELAESDLRSPVTHLVLAGALGATGEAYLYADHLWGGEDDTAAELWERDRPLFHVANKVRGLRAQRAWQALAAAGG